MLQLQYNVERSCISVSVGFCELPWMWSWWAPFEELVSLLTMQ